MGNQEERVSRFAQDEVRHLVPRIIKAQGEVGYWRYVALLHQVEAAVDERPGAVGVIVQCEFLLHAVPFPE